MAGPHQHFLQALTSSSMPLIYFVRHGQTDYNASKRIQGTLEIPINGKGREQARRNGSLLAELIGEQRTVRLCRKPAFEGASNHGDRARRDGPSRARLSHR